MCCELTVTCKDSERTTKQKFLLYDKFEFNQDDPTIMACIHEAVQKFGSDPEDIKLRCLLVVQ